MSTFKPMLASPVDFKLLSFTNIVASPKLDGCRAIVIGGVVMSRSLKPIPNKHVQAMFSHLEHFDGELIVGKPTSSTCYRDTASGVMSVNGTPDVCFYVFDHVEACDDEYATRYSRLSSSDRVVVLEQTRINNTEELSVYENNMISHGYEGVMLRAWLGENSRYKLGRATARSNTLLKLKRFSDSDAEIIGFDELMHNENEATKDALGHTERSSHQENLVPGNTLGALVVRDIHSGVEFKIGTGFDAAQRHDIWTNRHALFGRVVKYKHFEIGSKDKPRFPTFLGFRDAIDL